MTSALPVLAGFFETFFFETVRASVLVVYGTSSQHRLPAGSAAAGGTGYCSGTGATARASAVRGDELADRGVGSSATAACRTAAVAATTLAHLDFG